MNIIPQITSLWEVENVKKHNGSVATILIHQYWIIEVSDSTIKLKLFSTDFFTEPVNGADTNEPGNNRSN